MFGRVIVAIAALLYLSWASPAAAQKIRVGYPSHSASMYPIYATKEGRLFEKYGLDVEMIYVQGVQMYQVHVAGQLDLAAGSGLVALQASVGGADLILIANSIDTHLLKLIAHPTITGPADLKGKSVGISRFGSLTDLVARPLLASWGLDPKKDVTLIQIGTQRDIATAVQLKRVEAGVLSFPTTLYAEKAGMKVLYDFSESGVEIPTTSVIVSREHARKNREAVLRFLKAYVEGTKRLLTDRELGIRSLKRYGGIPDESLLASTYDLFTAKYIRKVPHVTMKSVENALRLIADTNPKAKERRAGEFVDSSFLDELERTGFIKEVWR